MAAVQPQQTGFRSRLVECCEAIPADPAAGDYVVVDAMHFSNTVIELLAGGAEYVHVTDERGQEFDYRATHPETVIGGPRTPDYRPADGYDFFNSPAFVQEVDVTGRPVSMTSSNGGRAVATLRARAGDDPDVDVFVGSPLNAAALAGHLRRRGNQVHLVSAGSGGEAATEDILGAALVDRYLDGVPLGETELDRFRRRIETARGPEYVADNDLRRRDVLDYAADINGRSVVPRLAGDRLVDVGRGTDRPGSE